MENVPWTQEQWKDARRRSSISSAVINASDKHLSIIEAVLNGKAERVGSRYLDGEHLKLYEVVTPMFDTEEENENG